MTTLRSATENDIPLYLIPVISSQINRRSKEVWRISVKRTHSHYYNISVRIKSIPRELRIQNHRIPLSEDNRDNADNYLICERESVGDPE
jgi:hypothetical protein